MKEIRNYQIFSIIFTFVLGTILHFTYKWYNKNPIVAIFSAVNESTWEHLKLLFFPMLITTIIGIFIFKKEVPNFLCSKFLGILTAIIFTIIFFYTYTGILGRNIAFIDISSFFFATTLGEILAYLLMINRFKCNKAVSMIAILLLFVSFIIFTNHPPRIGLFKDPITGQYGT